METLDISHVMGTNPISVKLQDLDISHVMGTNNISHVMGTKKSYGDKKSSK